MPGFGWIDGPVELGGTGLSCAAVDSRAKRIRLGFERPKVWTSDANIADFGLILARTERNNARQSGLTTFLVDMKDPAVDVRPLR